MTVKAVYYSDNNKLHETPFYEGFDASRMIKAGEFLQKEEAVEVDSIEIIETDEENEDHVLQIWNKNFLCEWFVNIAEDIKKHYEGEELQFIEAFDSCILGVVSKDSHLSVLYDSALIAEQLIRSDLATEDDIQFVMNEKERVYSECTFTDFPQTWLKRLNL